MTRTLLSLAFAAPLAGVVVWQRGGVESAEGLGVLVGFVVGALVALWGASQLEAAPPPRERAIQRFVAALEGHDQQELGHWGLGGLEVPADPAVLGAQVLKSW